MQTRRIGSLTVSIVGLGCNNFGMTIDEKQSADVVHAALDAGITFFDTADMYGGTDSERFLGKALGTRRHEAIVATKFGMRASDEFSGGARPDYIRRAVEGSLTRLNIDRIDLYQLHKPDPAVPIADTLGALDELVKAGTVGEIGCSNFSVAQMREAETAIKKGAAKFVSVQNEYSLLHRDPENDVLPECARLGLAFLLVLPARERHAHRQVLERRRAAEGDAHADELGRERFDGEELRDRGRPARRRGPQRTFDPRARVLVAAEARRRRVGHRGRDQAGAGPRERRRGELEDVERRSRRY